jgi:hypothetical protein
VNIHKSQTIALASCFDTFALLYWGYEPLAISSAGSGNTDDTHGARGIMWEC